MSIKSRIDRLEQTHGRSKAIVIRLQHVDESIDGNSGLVVAEEVIRVTKQRTGTLPKVERDPPIILVDGYEDSFVGSMVCISVQLNLDGYEDSFVGQTE